MKKIISLIWIGVLFMSCAKDNDVAVIYTPFGDMVVELYPEVSPNFVIKLEA